MIAPLLWTVCIAIMSPTLFSVAAFLVLAGSLLISRAVFYLG